MDNNVQFLLQVEIFSLLTVEEIEQVITNLHFIDIEKGEIIFEEGDEGNELFIVKSGRVVSSVRLPNGNKREIAEFTSGDFFGEMSIFENASRSATCYTEEKSLLIVLRERDFFELILYNPDIAMKIMYRMLNIITERLLEKNEFLSGMVQWGEEASKRVITDELTGIYNRRFLDSALEDYFEKAKSSKKPLSLIMVDIDHFKEISINYSQEQANQVILKIVAEFKKSLRKHDIFATYGGDEFTVILPDTKLKDAKLIAENICENISKLDISGLFNGQIKHVTVSQGIASYPENALDLSTLCKLADQSLYKAKVGGRNRVECTGII